MNQDYSKDKTIINAPYIWIGTTGWPYFSPDGTKIAFTADAYDIEKCHIRIIDLEDMTSTQITPNGEGAKRPTWHPDGSKLVYNKDNQTIWEVDLITKNKRPYISETVREDRKLLHPCYSPDGNSIIVASYQRGGIQREEVLYRVTNNPATSITQLTEFPQVCAGRAAINPLTSEIVFAGHAGHFNQVENRLWKVDNNRFSTVLEQGNSADCHGRCPAYSPDGKWIACVSTRPTLHPKEETPMSVWIISDDGQDPYKITDSSNNPSHMFWSPDQKKLAVTNLKGLQLINLPERFH